MLTGRQTSYLLNAVMYDQSRYPGPPMSVTHEAINELYGTISFIYLISFFKFNFMSKVTSAR
jgi:hypothetical protein